MEVTNWLHCSDLESNLDLYFQGNFMCELSGGYNFIEIHILASFW